MRLNRCFHSQMKDTGESGSVVMRKRKNIAMIGPVYPYKGGISHYTGLMYRALSDNNNVKMISYKLQYPRFLFKKEQRDYSNKIFKIDGVQYLINTANPFNCIKVACKIKKMGADMVIFQWWHPYFAPCYWIMEKALGKRVKKLFICHNVFPHERFPLDAALSKLVLKNGDYFITQSKLDTENLISIKKDAKYRQTVLPTFNAFKMKNMSREEAREVLEISNNTKIILFFGFIREYKGLKHIINALPIIKEKIGNIKLLIVGDFDGDRERYEAMIDENQVTKNVEIFDGYIPDNEVEKFFAAADLVVLPYESATQSGIVQIAYGFEKPVIVTNVGGLPDVVNNGKTGYIVPPKNPKAIADVVEKFFSQNDSKNFQINIQREAYKYSWERMTDIIESFE